MISSMEILKALVGGAAALFLAMGIGRFAFTPVLPIMQSDFGFTDTVSGALASVNYLGYLIGAMIAKEISGKQITRNIFTLSIPFSLLFILGMYFESVTLWYFLRFVSGLLSALVFVHASEFVIEHLIKNNKTQFTGVIYSGIGAGMILSGMTIPILSGYYNSSQIWLWLAVLSIIPAIIAYKLIPFPAYKEHKKGFGEKSKGSFKLYSLYLAYFLEGMGYIVTGTFISVIVLRGTGSVTLSSYVWVIAGVGAMLITPLWAILARRLGNSNTLVIAYFVQAIAIALPVLFDNTIITMVGAIGFGGTFLGIVSLSFGYGREISPVGKTTAVLTIFFSLGQMVGPLIAGHLADTSGGFYIPVISASATVAAGGLIIFITKGGKNAIH